MGRYFLLLTATGLALSAAGAPIGIFEEQSSIGNVTRPGSASFEPLTAGQARGRQRQQTGPFGSRGSGRVTGEASRAAYTMTGGGENMWAASDTFHFAWKRAKGDLALSAEISFVNASGDPHKKAVLMFRQSLSTDAAYASAALHNDGLTSLQARAENGARTHEIQSNTAGPTRLRLEKRGDMFYLYVAKPGQDFQFSGGAFRVPLQEPFYVGIGVCAHKKDTLETATFSSVALEPIAGGGKHRRRSTLETITVTSTDRRAMAVSNKRAGGPDWSGTGQFDFPAKSRGKATSEIPSPDGRRAVYLSLPKGKKSGEVQMFLVNTEGNRAPVFLAKFMGDKRSLGKSPWSPDSRRLVFVSYQFLP